MADHKIDGNDGAGNVDLIRRIDAMQACQVGPSDEWSKATKDGYNQAATDCAMAVLRVAPVSAANDEMTIPESETDYCIGLRAQLAAMTAERDELASAIDSIETNHGLTDNGNLWRFWAKTAREIAAKNTALAAERDAANARADQAEYRIVHIAAGLFPGGFDNNVAAIRDALRDKPAPVATEEAEGLTGPIEVGDEFIWMPNDCRARASITVIRVVPPNDLNEAMIWTRCPDGSENWNEESRFREACVRAIAASEA